MPSQPSRALESFANPHPERDYEVRFECPPELANLKVLVVDDEPDARDLVAEVATRCGCVVATAGSTGEALASVGAFHPDVIVSPYGNHAFS